MEGEHLLDGKGLVQVVINSVDNLTLRGERGHSDTDTIIKCSSNTRGIVFNNSNIVTIYGITITGCGQQEVSPLLFINIASLYIHHITLYNNTITSGGALYIHCGTDTHITITNSVFTNNTVGFWGGGLFIASGTDTHNHITITSSVFTNNTGYFGGGLFIHSDTDTHNNITITSSVFTNNTVYDGGGGVYIYSRSGTDTHNNITITSSVFTNNTVGSIGGGLFIHSGTDTHNHITIISSVFTNNTVGNDGGGVYIYSDTDTHNNITITNSVFTNNTGYFGGGLYILSGTDTHNNITITNSVFTNNTGYFGGGLYILSGTDTHNNITITSSVFTNNTVDYFGGGLYIYTGTDTHNNINITNSTVTYTGTSTSSDGGQGGLVVFCYTNMPTNIGIANSKFTGNDGSGVLLLYNVHVIFSQVTISKNNGPGIIAFNHVTVVFTEGHSIVANNSSPSDGGGIYLGKDSYLTTSNEGHVSFINNTAHRYGGAIYSLENDYYFGFTLQLQIQNQQCTVYDLSATFINNSAAIAGDHLYGGAFVLCHENGWGDENYLERLLSCTNVPETIKTSVSSVHPLSPVSSHPLVVCPCVNGTVNCTVRSLDRQVYPGQILHVSLVTVGLCGGVCPGTVVVDHDKQISLISNATTDYTSTSCTTLYYTVKLYKKLSNTMITFHAADVLQNDHIKVNLTILACPLGLILDSTLGECVCNNDIIHISGVICNISWMPYPIQRSGNNWISHRYTNCTIAHIGCPFDYCNTLSVKFNFNESDIQCNYNRSGILCGKCIQGLSLMLGSNRCANCTDTTLVSVSIIILAAVAGIALVILLIVLNLTVSVGSINGLLFYANLVKLNESVFFSRGNVPVVTQFISWCNLDMGFEYCFLPGMDGYVKTWLQFVFPLYVWLLVVVVIVACRYSGRLSRLCGRNAVPVLATLVLVSYTKVVTYCH